MARAILSAEGLVARDIGLKLPSRKLKSKTSRGTVCGTFASRLVMSGTDIRTVAELLRDKTLAMVMRYAHLAPDFKLDALERMASTFPQAKTNTKLTPAI